MEIIIFFSIILEHLCKHEVCQNTGLNFFFILSIFNTKILTFTLNYYQLIIIRHIPTLPHEKDSFRINK